MIKRATMKLSNRSRILLFFVLTVFVSSSAVAQDEAGSLLLHAARVFDGNSIRTHTSVLVINGKITQIGARGILEWRPKLI